MLAVQADGHDVMTVEGMATSSELHPIQEGFKDAHGLQCGFCTPGMMLTAKALLEENPNPTEDEVRWALSGNLCRCTGYQNIVKSVLWAADKMRPNRSAAETPEAALDEIKIGGMGASRKRVEDNRFIRGKGNYIDDIVLPGMLHMEILRSPLAHARITLDRHQHGVEHARRPARADRRHDGQRATWRGCRRCRTTRRLSWRPTRSASRVKKSPA